jgi:hypothetical protein
MTLIVFFKLIAIVAALLFVIATVKAKYLISELHHRLFAISVTLYALSIGVTIYIDFLTLPSEILVGETVYQWIRISAVTTLLCGMGVLVRNAKPNLTRAPLALAFLPLLLLLVHPFIIDTILLKDVLISMYHGGALLIAFMMFSVLRTKNSGFIIIIGGCFIFLGAYISDILFKLPTGGTELIVYGLLSIGFLVIRNGVIRINEIIDHENNI